MAEVPDEILSAMVGVVREARKVASACRKQLPLSSLDGALTVLDAAVGAERPAKASPEDDRILRDGLVAGEEYVLLAEGGAPRRFEYLGECADDRPAPGMRSASFVARMLPCGEEVKAWYADWGLEPYPGQACQVWHAANRVVRKVLSDASYGRLLDDLSGSVEDMIPESFMA